MIEVKSLDEQLAEITIPSINNLDSKDPDYLVKLGGIASELSTTLKTINEMYKRVMRQSNQSAKDFFATIPEATVLVDIDKTYDGTRYTTIDTTLSVAVKANKDVHRKIEDFSVQNSRQYEDDNEKIDAVKKKFSQSRDELVTVVKKLTDIKLLSGDASTATSIGACFVADNGVYFAFFDLKSNNESGLKKSMSRFALNLFDRETVIGELKKLSTKNALTYQVSHPMEKAVSPDVMLSYFKEDVVEPARKGYRERHSEELITGHLQGIYDKFRSMMSW